MPSRALSASTALTAARTVPVVMEERATTSRGSASVPPASADAGTRKTHLKEKLLHYHAPSLLCSTKEPTLYSYFANRSDSGVI